MAIKPWVTKKMVEYLGDDTGVLIDFIIAKLRNRCEPHELVAELELILDEDAIPFIMKLWRMLIFSIKNM